ncbi:tyrosine-type recombinase/integrase [Phytohabitans sp. ZYX-F-186]|uniref:Tyrosine-type recombinase/integrase n=1 Tax=Phytohabitans maris TaxID=3071409 RepID=A0ABU0ZCQ0_9ACTN|nr:tyrosine-type recombinase/integrase [Phytohabitans sp. ZYX-F-186]MDQ7904834.1 tyrosine-type recombinase/integrase [Phytohabitans sp. ZYX-F-186]
MGGNSKGRKRRFGSVRQMRSGRWQARYTGLDGLTRTAPDTFDAKRAAEQWLVEVEAEMLRGDWVDPDAGKVLLTDYADRWVRERDLKPRTREEYARLLRLHVRPYLDGLSLAEVTPQRVRTWRSALLAAGIGRSTVAKTYRVLHAIFATGVDDDLIRRNPCRIKGAGQDDADERPMATLDQVFAIAEAIQRRYRLLVLLATFAQLRFGELVALRRRGIDLAKMELRVRQATAELEDGTQLDDDPKSQAGKRPIALPHGLRADIEIHLSRYAQPGPDGRLFVGPQGGVPRRRNFNRVWHKALRDAGIPADMDLHLHDLRHTGSTWSAQSGATLREVMKRIGHSSTRAAMIYQHATRDRDRAIATALDALIEESRQKIENASGTDLAREAESA